MWITHFPPLLQIDNTLKLLYPKNVLKAAMANGVRHIIAGHLHRDQVNNYSDVTVFCTGSASSTSAGELYGNWIDWFDIEVTNNGVVSINKVAIRYSAANV